MRSNARASWPSSSGLESTIGSSNLPLAIRSAARSSRRMRRREEPRAAEAEQQRGNSAIEAEIGADA